VEVDSEVWVLFVAGGCGIGSDGIMVVVSRGKPISVSDLYRGRVGGTVFDADALTPAEAECDRLRPSVDGTGSTPVGGCVFREGDMGKGVVISEFGG
jgi:hypothetical protein